MHPKLKNVLAVIVGLVVGSIANMIVVMIGPVAIPPPDGVDVTNMESIRLSMHLFEFKHFVFPFLAHALGTLAGAFLAAVIAASFRMAAAMAVGGLFLIGGIVNAFSIGAPALFTVVDLIGRLHTYGLDRCKINRKSVGDNPLCLSEGLRREPVAYEAEHNQ